MDNKEKLTAEKIVKEIFYSQATNGMAEESISNGIKLIEAYACQQQGTVTEEELNKMALERYCSPHGNANPETAAFIAGYKAKPADANTLQDILTELTEVHNLLAKSQLPHTQYQPISGLIISIKEKLYGTINR